MSKSIQIAGRKIAWSKEEPGPILILIVTFTLLFAAKCFLSDSPTTSEPPAVQVDAR